MFEMALSEVGADHFSVMIGERGQIDAGAKTDFECASGTFACAFCDPCNEPVAARAMKPSARRITRMVKRFQQPDELRFRILPHGRVRLASKRPQLLTVAS